MDLLGLNRGYMGMLLCVVLWLYCVFFIAACRCPMADMAKLAVRQVIRLFGVFGNMWVCRVCRGRQAKNSSRGISIVRGKSIVAFLKPTFFVSHTKSLLRSLFGN